MAREYVCDGYLVRPIIDAMGQGLDICALGGTGRRLNVAMCEVPGLIKALAMAFSDWSPMCQQLARDVDK